MTKKKIPVALVLGVALIAISLSMIVFVQLRAYMSSGKADSVVAEMNKMLPERSAGVPDTYPNPNMPCLEIGGTDFMAMVEIPSAALTLPVADVWDSGRLYESPARFCGSVYDNTLVIGGADHPYQFSFCKKIENDAVVTITDMTGTQFTYKVATVDRAKTADAAWLSDKDHDLTLYCRSSYSMEYVAVRCDFAYS